MCGVLFGEGKLVNFFRILPDSRSQTHPLRPQNISLLPQPGVNGRATGTLCAGNHPRSLEELPVGSSPGAP